MKDLMKYRNYKSIPLKFPSKIGMIKKIDGVKKWRITVLII